jgi:hypothetical protein
VAASSAPGDSTRRISWFNRVLAPIALIAVLIAVFAIVSQNTGDSNKTEQDTKAKIDSEGKKDGSGAENPRS